MQAFAEPHSRELGEATRVLRKIDSSIVSTEVLVGWSVDHERVEQLRAVVSALDSWKRWADGHDVPIGRLEGVLHVLEGQHDPTIASPCEVLGDTVRRWADQHGVELAPRLPSVDPALSVELPSLGIEL